jgi:CPA2 family monovalent cation:H+ antiporter-2
VALWIILKEILLLLCAAYFLGVLAQRLKQSPILGYLMAGTIIGPLLFNAQAVFDVAELGVALLLFSIGLEFSLQRLKSMGRIALGIGTLQVCITMFLFAAVFSFFFPFKQAVILGAMGSLSSTAVVLRVLADRAEIDSSRGRNALGILLLQDIAVVPLVLMVSVMNQQVGGGILWSLLQTLAAAAGIVVAFYLLFYIIFPRLLMTEGLFTNRELFVILTLATALGSIWMAHALGLSPALGAFLAGMLLGESPFATQIRTDIGSIRTLFVTLFFTSIGMLANPGWFVSNMLAVFFWLMMVFLIKSLVIYGICRVFKMSALLAMATGFTLGQIGEFSFVLAGAALSGDLISRDTFNMVVSVSILSLFVAPYMVIYAFPLAKRILKKIMPKYDVRPEAETQQIHEAECGIGIVGFGPAGQRVAATMLERGLRPFVIEMNPKTARIARERGLKVHLGDAAFGEILSHAGVQNASIMVVTLPDPRTARLVISNIRLTAPQATIIARGRYHISIPELEKAGSRFVVDEENGVGNAMAQKITECMRQGSEIFLACGLAGEEPTVVQ